MHMTVRQSEPHATDSKKSAPLVVLLVDDDVDCRMLIRDAIEEAESRRVNLSMSTRPLIIREVDCGEAALRFLRREGEFANAERPGLIYMDVEMPGIGGLEAVRQLKSDERFKDIPTVMFSGLSDPTAMAQAAESGANSYTVKPADAERFMQTVLRSTDYWLHVHQTPQRHPDQAECRR